MTPGGSSGAGALSQEASREAARGGPGGDGRRGRTAAPFVAVVCITVTGIMAHVLITPALPDIGEDLDVASTRLGLLVAAGTAPGIVLAPAMGMLSDRFGRRQVVVPCLVLFGVAGGGGCFAPGFEALVALRLLQGVASAGLVNLAVVIITDHWEGRERAGKIGQNAAALTASIVVLPPVGGLLTSWGGWRATFAPYWLALAAAGLVAYRLPSSRPREEPVTQQLRAAGRAVRSVSVLAPMALGTVAFVLIFGLFLTLVPLYLSESFGVGGAGRGLVMSLPAVTATVGALSLGRVRGRLGARPLVAAGLVLFALGFGLMALVPTLAAVCAGALLYGLGDGLVIATLLDVVAEGAPEDSRGAVVATWMSFARTGQTAGPVLAGAGSAAVGARVAFAAGAAVAALAAFAAPHLLGKATAAQRSLRVAPPVN